MRFNSTVRVLDEEALSLDDVLIIPRYSEVKSRLDTVLSTKLTKDIHLPLPICSAAMDTVTETELAIALSNAGGVGFLHRFADDSYIVNMVKDIKEAGATAVASIGVREDIVNWVGVLLNSGVDAISMDIAHGDSVGVINTVSLLKKVFPHLQIIAGNVCTAGATSRLISAGADAVKVGVGGGHACKTRIVTGCGVPNFSALCECYSAARQHKVPIIMDGGIKNSGDIVKSLAAGADVCMMGFLFSRTQEAPGPVHKIDGAVYKEYRGMASYEAQLAFKGGMKSGTAAEGESMLVPVRTTVGKLVEELAGGVRSGMTYCGATTLEGLRTNASFIRVTHAGAIESRPFGLDMSDNVA